MGNWFSDTMQGEARSRVDNLIKRAKAAHKDEAEAIAAALREAAEIGFDNEEPGKTCLDLFLGAKTDEWSFDLSTLLSEDKNVRERIYNETIRRAMKAVTDREKEKVAGFGVWAPAELERRINDAIDPVITLFQHTYSHIGWWGALGNFGIDVEVVQASSIGDRLFVRLSGEGVYKWAPDQEGRPTVELHKLAQRLIEMGKAKEFRQIAKPATFVVNVAQARLLDPNTGRVITTLTDYSKQTDPKSGLSRAVGQGWRSIGR